MITTAEAPATVRLVLYADCDTADLQAVEIATVDSIVLNTDGLTHDDILSVSSHCSSITVEVVFRNVSIAEYAKASLKGNNVA